MCVCFPLGSLQHPQCVCHTRAPPVAPPKMASGHRALGRGPTTMRRAGVSRPRSAPHEVRKDNAAAAPAAARAHACASRARSGARAPPIDSTWRRRRTAMALSLTRPRSRDLPVAVKERACRQPQHRRARSVDGASSHIERRCRTQMGFMAHHASLQHRCIRASSAHGLPCIRCRVFYDHPRAGVFSS